jgi:small-conductance mechanosensitive channel
MPSLKWFLVVLAVNLVSPKVTLACRVSNVCPEPTGVIGALGIALACAIGLSAAWLLWRKAGEAEQLRKSDKWKSLDYREVTRGVVVAVGLVFIIVVTAGYAMTNLILRDPLCEAVICPDGMGDP